MLNHRVFLLRRLDGSENFKSDPLVELSSREVIVEHVEGDGSNGVVAEEDVHKDEQGSASDPSPGQCGIYDEAPDVHVVLLPSDLLNDADELPLSEDGVEAAPVVELLRRQRKVRRRPGPLV